MPFFSDATHRRRQQELKAFHGRTVAHKQRINGQEIAKLGKVIHKGNCADLKCFRVKFSDGSVEEMSAVQVRNRLMPQ